VSTMRDNTDAMTVAHPTRRRSTWPLWLVALLVPLGPVIALVMARPRSLRARQRGLPTAGYWAPAVVGIGIYAVIAVVSLVVTASHNADGAGAPTNQTQTQHQSQDQALSRPATQALVLPTESASDAPKTVVHYMVKDVLGQAFANLNPAYLDHYYASSSAPSYQHDYNLVTVQGMMTNTLHVISDPQHPLKVQSQSPTSFTASFWVQNDSFDPAHISGTFTFNSTLGEWRFDG
jgi:hypothetical protein